MAGFMSPAQAQQFGPPTIEGLEHALHISRITAAANYACVAIMLWDMLLTMDMEVRLLWKSKISVLKIAFLINRYVAPAVNCVNIYFVSGQALLTDQLCRGWLLVAALLQTLCVASISFLFAFRLWAWYEVSARVLYALLLVWASSIVASMLLVIDFAGVHNADIMHESFLNICVNTAPVVWPQWLPATLEHGIYAIFLLFNAMATPRSEQKAALAIIYRDGIIFYMLTFLVSFGSLLIWALAPRLYMGLGLYPPWTVFQVGISRLLLNVRTSQIFATRMQPAGQEDTYLETRGTPLRDMISPRGRASHTVASYGSSSNGTSGMDEEAEMGPKREPYFPSFSKNGGCGREVSGSQGGGDHSRGNAVGREIRRINPNAGSLRTRFWWLFRRSEIADIHIEVMQADNLEDSGWGESSGGVKLSRLGRRDEWF